MRDVALLYQTAGGIHLTCHVRRTGAVVQVDESLFMLNHVPSIFSRMVVTIAHAVQEQWVFGMVDSYCGIYEIGL